MELEFDKYCLVDASPTTVLPPLRRREKKKPKEKSKCGNDMLSLNVDDNFTEIRFHHYRSALCKNAPRRGSVYQCSQEISQMKNIDNLEVRGKIEISRNSATGLACGVVDSVCSSDEDTSRSSDLSTSRINDPRVEINSRDFANLSSSPYVMLNKSLLAKLALPQSPAPSESDSSRASSPRARFTPIRRMFDPFVKSRSHKSLLNSGETKNRAFRKSLLQDFSNTAEKGNQDSPLWALPAHLHGLIKLENKDGIPFFEFAMKSPEDILVAKTWKVKDSSTWVYTFHSVQNKRWGLRYSNKESSVVAQMQVSCYLHQELKRSVLDKSMVTEFVLYDIARLRKSVSSQDNSSSTSSPDHCDHAHGSGQFYPSASHPLAPEELNPGLESAAVVIQVPFEKRESLKFKKIDQTLPKLLDFPKVNVVIPSGNHGLPTIEGHGPAPLLDRWRLGGACDCGGWDMACPLHLFSNSNIPVGDDQCPPENQSPFELFVQGKKDKAPALTMRVTEGGHYAVDFHAQLSALQAFSICISILHTIEASSVVSNEKIDQPLQCDSLRVFVEDKISNLIDALMEEEKCKVDKKIEEVVPSFVVNPPFSECKLTIEQATMELGSYGNDRRCRN